MTKSDTMTYGGYLTLEPLLSALPLGGQYLVLCRSF